MGEFSSVLIAADAELDQMTAVFRDQVAREGEDVALVALGAYLMTLNQNQLIGCIGTAVRRIAKVGA